MLGKLIYDINCKKLNKKYDLLVTVSEDTKINFNLFNKSNKTFKYLRQSIKHLAAIRKTLFLSYEEIKRFDKKQNKFYIMKQIFISSVGTLSQSYLQKFFVIFEKENNFVDVYLDFVYILSIENHVKCSQRKLSN